MFKLIAGCTAIYLIAVEQDYKFVAIVLTIYIIVDYFIDRIFDRSKK